MIIARVEMFGWITSGSVHNQYEIISRMKKLQKLIDLENLPQEIEEGEVEVKESWPKTGDITI